VKDAAQFELTFSLYKLTINCIISKLRIILIWKNESQSEAELKVKSQMKLDMN